MLSRHTSRLFAGILLLYLLLATWFSLASPIFETPDELNHVYVVKYLVQHQRLPVLSVDKKDAEMAMIGQEGGQPPLYYMIGALLISGINLNTDAPSANPHANIGIPMQPGNKNKWLHAPAEAWPWHGMPLAVHWLRFYSILLGIGTLFFSWRIVSKLLPHQKILALAVVATIAFLPQFLFIAAAVSNDNLIILLATAGLWLLLQMFGPDLRRTPGRGQALALGLVLGLAALSKLSGLNLWGLATVAYLLHLYRQHDFRKLWPSMLITAGAAMIIVLPWYGRNWLLYHDPTALSAFLSVVGPRQTPIHPRTEFQGLRVSLLGLFGWFNIPLPNLFYHIWDALWALSLLGLWLGAWRRRHQWRHRADKSYLLILGLWLLLMIISLIRWTSITPGTQGRLLFPALLSLMLLLILGWHEWLPARRLWLTLPPLFLLATSFYSVAAIIPAAYRPPAMITPAAVPTTAAREPLVFDERIALLGYELHPATVHPGDTITLTLYWQALQEIPYDASLYIHLLGPDYQSVAQIDTYPGWGLAPTRQWQPGQVLVDRYQLDLPWQMNAPTKLLLDVGFYDFSSKQRYPVALASGQTPPLGLTTLRVLPAATTEPTIAHATNFEIDTRVRLAGFDLPQQDFKPGETVPLTLYWQALVPVNEDFQVFVHLVDAQGQQIAGIDKAPRDNWWPSSLWEPGNIFADDYPMQLPPTLPPGSYQLRAGLYRLSDFSRPPMTGAPDHIIDNAAVLTNITLSP